MNNVIETVLAAVMAGAMALPVPAVAQTTATIRKVEQACAQQIIRAVQVPGEMKLLEHTKKHSKNPGGVLNFYTVCYQSRNQQGGFAFVYGACDYGDDGVQVGPLRLVDGSTSIRSDINVSNMFCKGGS
jgi:hypothetical protein